MFCTHVCVDVPFSNSMGIALVNTNQNILPYFDLFDSEITLLKSINISMGKSRKIKIKTPYFSKCTYLVDLDVNGKIYLSKQ